MFEPLQEGARDVCRDPFQKHPRAAGHLLAHARGDRGDVQSRPEIVFGDRVRDVDRERDVDQVVVPLLLIGGRRALPAATAQAPDEDPTGELTPGWHTSGTVSVEWMTCL